MNDCYKQTGLDLSKQVQTRDGRPVRILTTDKAGKFSIVALIREGPNDELTATYTPDGHFSPDHEISRHDLINPPKSFERSVWVNIYEQPNEDCFHQSREDADSQQSPTNPRIACVFLTYRVTRGDGL